MKISHSWLKRYIDLNEPIEELSELLTQSGLEVEGVERHETIPGGLKGVVIGEVLTCEKHPNADKLSVTTVDIGQENPSPIVCGAPNVTKGQKVIVATVNSMLHPTSGDAFKIKKAKIRGEVSEGMICAEDEIGLGESHDGIMVLDTDLPNGSPASTYFNLSDDYVFEIGLTPNRADGASHYGVSRDLKALLNRETKLAIPALENLPNEFPIDLSVENEEACPRYSGIVLENIKVGDSPDWLKQFLLAIGLSPINNVVDITNYICHGLGQPMHAFDLEEIKGSKIIVKTDNAGKKFTTLDEKERTLLANDLMICNESEGMCIAGVFGGLKSGVTEKTTSIFLESAYFSPDYVRKTSLSHGLKTDASFRYERGTDPNITIDALKVAVELLGEVTGATPASGIYDHYPSPIENFRIAVKYKNIDRLIGKQIEQDRIKSILTNLDIQVTEESEIGFTAIVPPYRVDVTREADITEEILRIYGFNNIPVDDYNGADYLSGFEERDTNKLRRYVSQMLVGSGYSEILTNSLTNPSYSEQTKAFNAEENVVILNKLSEELGVLRQSLIFGGLESIAHNVNRKYTGLRFFEIGNYYYLQNGKYQQKQQLVLFLTGNQKDENWLTESQKVIFHHLSDTSHKVLQQFNFQNLDSVPTDLSFFDYGLDLQVNGKTLCSMGKLSSSVTSQAGVKQEVFYACFDWDALVKKYQTKIEYVSITKFPEVRKDLSLILDQSVTFDAIKELSFKTERKLLKQVNVFSVYEGDNIGKGKKSYAISFILQDVNKTLTDKHIDKVMKNLIRAFEEKIHAIIRK